MRWVHRCLFLALLGSSFVGTDGHATTRWVPSAEYPTIQPAIDASAGGDTVLIGPGVYQGAGNTDLVLRGVDIVLVGTGGASSTLIGSTGEERGITCPRRTSGATVIRGFTLRGGFTGILCLDGASPTVEDVVIRERERAVVCYGGNARFRSCVIAENTGGGINLYGSEAFFEDCVIRSNEGGGVSSEDSHPGFYRCVIAGNVGVIGGGLTFSYAQAPDIVIEQCTITGNRASESGGGLFMDSAWVLLDRTVLRDNCCGTVGDDAYLTPSDFLSRLRLQCCGITESGIVRGNQWQILEYIGPQVYADPQFCDAASCAEAPTEDGTYTISATSPYAPGNSPCGDLIGARGVECGVLGVPETEEGLRNIRVWPNPTTGRVHLSFGDPPAGPISAYLLDVGGRRVATFCEGRHLPAGSVDFDLGREGRELAPGLHFLVVTGAKEPVATRLVIVR